MFLKKIGYVSICCFVHEPQGIFAVFFRCPIQGGNRGFLQWIFLGGIRDKSWSARVFFAALERIFAVSLDNYSWEGFETNRGLRGCFLMPGGDKGVSLKVLFCYWRFLQFFLDALYRSTVYFAGFFRHSWK